MVPRISPASTTIGQMEKKVAHIEAGTLILIKGDHVATTKWIMGRIIQMPMD